MSDSGTLRDLLDALSVAEASRQRWADFSAKSQAAGPALAGTKAAYLAILAGRECDHATTAARRAAAIPGADRLKTLCIARLGEYTAQAVRRLAAEAALAHGSTLDAVASLPVAEAIALMAVESSTPADTTARSEGAAATPEKAGAGSKTGKRGRPKDTDPAADRRIAEAWDTGQYKALDDLAAAFGTSKPKVKLALDRHRKRQDKVHDALE